MANLYSKGKGTLELKDPLNVNIASKGSKIEFKLDVSDNYQKKDGTLDPSLFIIVSGGEKREKDYFSYFNDNNYKHKFPRIKIEFFTKQYQGLNVDQLVNEGIRIKKEKENSKGRDIIDSINLVTDVDDYYPQIKDNIRKCIEYKLQLIISNPCFEQWLYYSYFDSKPDYQIPAITDKISSGFKSYLHQKKDGGVDSKKALLLMSNAIINSKKNYEEDENGIPKLFSTQMHNIAERLYELVKDDLENFVKELEKNRLDFKSIKIKELTNNLNSLSFKELNNLKDYLLKFINGNHE